MEEFDSELNRLNSACEYLRGIISLVPKVAIVLGSGLGECLNNFEIEYVINYHDIPYLQKPTVETHKGRYLIGRLDNIPIIVMQGRIHYYEGYDMADVVRPIRVMKMLGARKIILTNSAGAINCSFNIGQFVLIKDQIASFLPSPLRGTNADSLGIKFPDMSNIYDKKTRIAIKKIATEKKVDLNEGVYLQTAGPNFESPAEISMYKVLGADLVGMSTACEAIAARHMGMTVCGISFISNMASGITKKEITFEEIMVETEKMKNELSIFLSSCVKGLARDLNYENKTI